MNKIKIKNFGPIKEGFTENEGWMEINKVTVFIGNQGSGKSTVAKLISTFTWLEKALIRGDVKEHMLTHNYFIQLVRFHRIDNYFKFNSEFEYVGAIYHIKYSKQSITLNKFKTKSVKQPKIMYVPAERNFLSSISNINKVSNLITGSLHNYSIEFRYAQLAHQNKPFKLPINNAQVIYDPVVEENFIELPDRKRLKLTEASSGFHSIVPLTWVTQYLIDFIKQKDEVLLDLLSSDQTIRRDEDIKMLYTIKVSDNLDDKTYRKKEQEINAKYISKYLINIVEEPEQNLFPSSQRLLLHQLLAFNTGKNKLIMTTHSPYLINYLTLAVEADKLKEKAKEASAELKKRLNDIVPSNATIAGDHLTIYQLDEKTGTISKLKTYKGLPSDENYLNDGLAETNDLFSKILTIEDELCQ